MLPPGARRAILTTHIAVSVGLLGDSAGFLAVAVRAATITDTDRATALYEVLEMFSAVFGIPLTVAALITGVTLGLGSRWGVLRSPWVTIKLLLLVSVMLVGTFVIGPAEVVMLDGTGDTRMLLIAGGAYDVLALAAATALSVYKPGRTRRRAWWRTATT